VNLTFILVLVIGVFTAAAQVFAFKSFQEFRAKARRIAEQNTELRARLKSYRQDYVKQRTSR